MNIKDLSLYAKNTIKKAWRLHGIENTEERIKNIYKNNTKLCEYMLIVHRQLLIKG